MLYSERRTAAHAHGGETLPLNFLNTSGKAFGISLSFSFVVVHTTFLLYSMQLDQSENFYTDYMQGYLYVRLSKYTLQYLIDG